ncbi:IS200/IS605 family element transposase accessory protein TnpB (plasmid) [Pontibacillus sp. ALD_SL1]|uniref:RNA-guided endonuclease InsQ/TnpB family protein n=1 Tax=Pontibacillus sp. ALD_SL1 TaxID=2777185 RepID=UPI001A96272B|nr:RNA-guided endonuclease TnpB family protein [Pontibacillus sp. ALD_SL1]QST02325.1 IS200/IS605 family element transposase accessory protein TnpB [Pontibacillus sp. ALD_SL1]
MSVRTYKFVLHPSERQRALLDTLQLFCSYVSNAYMYITTKYSKSNDKNMKNSEVNDLLNAIKTKYSSFSSLSTDIVHAVGKEVIKAPHQHTPITFIPLKKTSIKNEFVSIGYHTFIPYKQTRPLPESPNSISNVQIKKQGQNWFVYCYIYQPTTSVNPRNLHKFVGIDVGLKEFAILSNGTRIPNPRYYRTMEHKIKMEQQKLNNKIKNSKRWSAQKERLGRLHQKIHNQRKDFIHKTANDIIKNFDVIGVESLSIQKMNRNRKFSKSILDASWGDFISTLKYKAEDQGKALVEVDRFYPSSQLCSVCGSKQIMPLKLRLFKCNTCSAIIERDYNASLNIEREAKNKFLEQYVFGEQNLNDMGG